jgi:hypothetical protein
MTKTKTRSKNRARTYARNRAHVSRRGNEIVLEKDSIYFLKLVIYTLLGTLWLKFSTPIVWLGVYMNGLPVGLVVGLLLVSQVEKIQEDRKIWYAVLIIVTIISYFVPAGIVV